MQVLGTPHRAPTTVWNCCKRATIEGVHVIFCISFTQYYCFQMCYMKEQFHLQETEDPAPGTWESWFFQKAALSSIKIWVPQSRKGWIESLHFSGTVYLTHQWSLIHWRLMTWHGKALKDILNFKHVNTPMEANRIAYMLDIKHVLMCLAEAGPLSVDTSQGPWIWNSSVYYWLCRHVYMCS